MSDYACPEHGPIKGLYVCWVDECGYDARDESEKVSSVEKEDGDVSEEGVRDSINTGTDVQRAINIVSALCEDPEWVEVMTIPGQPRSKARPRFGKGGKVYTPRTQVENEKKLAWHLRQHFDSPNKRGNFAIGCIFFRSTRQRIDVDNMMKQVMDAATGVCWKDDVQVTAQLGVVELDKVNPRTVVAIAPHSSSMVRPSYARKKTCVGCGEKFQPRLMRQKYCSRECTLENSRRPGKRAVISCDACGERFRRKETTQRYCSDECRINGQREERSKPPNTCDDCGKELMSRISARCRECWKESIATEFEGDDEGVLEVPCPYCDAGEGELCRSPKGVKYPWAHAARVKAA